MNIFNGEHHCEMCQKKLAWAPLFEVHGKEYCYLCAKSELTRICDEANNAADEKYQAEFGACEKESERIGIKISIQKARAGITAGLFFISVAWSFLKINNHPGLFADPNSPLLPLFLLNFSPALVVGAIHLWARSRIKSSQQELANILYPTRPVLKSVQPVLACLQERKDVESAALPPNYPDAVFERDNYTCQECGFQAHAGDLKVHVVQPKVQGGSEVMTNMVSLCLSCHLREATNENLRNARMARKLNSETDDFGTKWE